MTRTWEDLLWCLEDVIGKPMEEKIKPMRKTDPKTVLGEYIYSTGTIKIGVSEEYVPAILAHEQMHKVLLEVLEGMESVKAAIQYDNIKDMVDTFINPYLIFIPSVNIYAQKHGKKL